MFPNTEFISRSKSGLLNPVFLKSILLFPNTILNSEFSEMLETLKFRDLYHEICYKIAVNIDSKSIIGSIHLISLIRDKNVNLSDIANLSGKKLCPEKYEKITKKINLRVNQEVKIKYSSLYRCFRCKNNKCTSERVYNRSLDEGVNLLITCTVCYNEWGA